MTTAVQWSPHTARAAGMAHAWVTGWHTGGLEAIVTDARAAGWECLLIEGTHNPVIHTARAKVLAAGATIIGPDPRDIRSALTTVDEVLRRRLNSPRTERQTLDRRPVLLLVSDGDHIPHDALQRVAALGRAADVHLAVDERARRRTPIDFNANVLAVYRGPRPSDLLQHRHTR